MDENRICALCLASLPIESFARNGPSLGGRLRACKPCVNAKRRAWAAANGKPRKPRTLEILARRLAWSASNNTLECRTCRVVKPLSDFKKNPTYFTGRDSRCKPCGNVARQEYRSANRAKCRAANRRYEESLGEERKALRAARKNEMRRASELSREREKRRRSLEANRLKVAARNAVNNAVNRGLIAKGPCEVCGSKRTHGHHDDYTKPLAVRWLCQTHHRAWHANHQPLPAQL
jgi:hypothetical protein